MLTSPLAAIAQYADVAGSDAFFQFLFSAAPARYDELKRKADALVQKRLDQAATTSPQTAAGRQAQEIDTGAPAAPEDATPPAIPPAHRSFSC